MAPTDNTVARTLHDVGLAAWFGGSLMGAAGVNGAAAVQRVLHCRLRRSVTVVVPGSVSGPVRRDEIERPASRSICVTKDSHLVVDHRARHVTVGNSTSPIDHVEINIDYSPSSLRSPGSREIFVAGSEVLLHRCLFFVGRMHGTVSLAGSRFCVVVLFLFVSPCVALETDNGHGQHKGQGKDRKFIHYYSS
jgi:hypothetical protein